MRVTTLAIALTLAMFCSQTAVARDPIARPTDSGDTSVAKTRPGKSRPVEGASSEVASGEAETVGLPDPNAPAVEAGDEDLWSWVSRLEGEQPPPEAVEEIKERSEEQYAELKLIDQLATTDVPVEFYTDPKKALVADPLHLDEIDASEFDIPIAVNDDVVKWMKYFTGSGRKYYERWLSRSSRYRPMMYKALEEQGLPQDLVYLSMIESGYSPHAYSSADAAGLWQFIPSTGRLYKLRIDYWVDERRDPELSTIAALAFLKDLYKMQGDWMLAWASYNTGPGRVKKAAERAGTKDFWTIEAGPYLHPETDNYVPKIIAAAIIGHHPERYGFKNIAYQDELTYDVAMVEGSVDLAVLAKCAGLSLEEFQALNPALRHWATPPEGFPVRVPTGSQSTFMAALETVPKVERVATSEHRVIRGETLSIIAAKYDTSVTDIVRANHLSDRDIIRVGQTLMIPGGRADAIGGSGDTRVAEVTTTRTASDVSPAPATKVVKTAAKYYTVRSGDTLTEIAGKYDVSVTQIKSWNSVRGDKILVGQRLKVASGGTTTVAVTSTPAARSSSGSTPTSTSSATSSATKTTYTVKRGDALSSIAERHGVSMSDVQRWNKISNPSEIFVGQHLTIYAHGAAASSGSSATTTTKYTVRSGDSLGAIATKYGVTVAQLREWNGLSSTVIQPGQVLKVRK